jgi:four helix bundle protein
VTAVQRFEDLVAWQKARLLAKEIYLISSSAPISKDFGYRDQFTRAAISIMNNIAEGFGRRGDKEFAYYLKIAKGSAAEVQSMLYVGYDIQYVEQAKFESLLALARETAAVVSGLLDYVSGKSRGESESLRQP